MAMTLLAASSDSFTFRLASFQKARKRLSPWYLVSRLEGTARA
jgi:hypothetical protein